MVSLCSVNRRTTSVPLYWRPSPRLTSGEGDLHDESRGEGSGNRDSTRGVGKVHVCVCMRKGKTVKRRDTESSPQLS